MFSCTGDSTFDGYVNRYSCHPSPAVHDWVHNLSVSEVTQCLMVSRGDCISQYNYGVALAWQDGDPAADLTPANSCSVMQNPEHDQAYAVDADADWIASDAEAETGSSRQHFHLTHRGTDMGYFDIALPGVHNVANSTAVVAVSEQIGLDLEDVRSALSTFRGAARRFEVVGEMLGVTVVDDFAHHPTELRSLLQSARRHYRGRRLVCVFQPHQYSRTLHFLDDFAEVLPLADLAIVAPIYEARDSEEYREAVSAEDVAQKAAEHGADVVAVESFLEAEKHLVRVMRHGDVVLTVGAGDVWKIAKRVVRRLRRRHSLQ